MFSIQATTRVFKPLVKSLASVRSYHVPTKKRSIIPIYGPLPTAHGKEKGQLMNQVKADLFAKYDPNGIRQKLFDSNNPEKLRTGDVVRITFKDSFNNPSYVGYLLAIDRNGPDTTILLRSKITQVGVEKRFSVFNPIIDRIDRVRRPHIYNRRNRHYYIRGSRKDAGDYDGKRG